jgi:2-desacetyl-2-hydroxyethyl bacteriochlorophyllide A dehydrogenase
MFQVKLKAPFKIEYDEGEPPVTREGEAIVSVASNGICGSDMHRYRGHEPIRKPNEVAGHEFAGTIKEIRGSAPALRPGMKVAVNPSVNCGSCFYCAHGDAYLCENQVFVNGMTEEVAVPLPNLVPLGDSFDLLLAPLIEPAAVAVHAVGRISRSTVLIIGLGTVGLLAQQVCLANGNTVVTTDPADQSIALSRKLGAECAVNAGLPDRMRIIEKSLGDRRIDYVVDNVCTEETVNFAASAVKKGGEVIVIGVCNVNLSIDYRTILLREVDLQASYLYTHDDFLKAAALVTSGRIETRPLVSKVFPLRSAREAFAYKHAVPSVKVVLTGT